MSRAVEKATFVQDVISAATHLIHQIELTDRERSALELLRSTSGKEAGDEPPLDGPQLEPAEPEALIRTARTALPEDPELRQETLHALSLVLDGGALDEHGLQLISDLRKTFIGLARDNFESISAAKHLDGELGLWEPLRTSSIF
jgi:hypothetical protein